MRRGERGLAVSVEAAVVLPVIVAFIGLLLTLGRVSMAEQHVGAAAAAGARAASLERSVAQGRRKLRPPSSALFGSETSSVAQHLWTPMSVVWRANSAPERA